MLARRWVEDVERDGGGFGTTLNTEGRVYDPEEGIYVIGFFYPVVPKDTARIRVQLSAAHTEAHIDKALAAFAKVGQELGGI